MTEEEALKYIETHDMEMIHFLPQDFVVAIKKSIEKQIPKKRYIKELDDDVPKKRSITWLFDVCGACGEVIAVRYYKYCPNCGQAIDWGAT